MKISVVLEKILVFVWLATLRIGVVRGQLPFSYQHVERQFDENFLEDEGTRWFCMVLGVCMGARLPETNGGTPGLAPVFEWRQLEFDYASASDRQKDVDRGTFIPGTPAPIDVDVYYAPDGNNKIFTTVPRFQAGIPVTLGTVENRTVHGNPVIKPYPSWEWHKNPNQCRQNRIVSVYRVQIDECGRLWVLDTGRLVEEQTCPPQILAFDLQTNELLHRYEIPSSQLESRSILVTPIVDVRDANNRCRDTFVYVADCQTYSIIVYDVKRDVSWKATDKTMYPYPNYGTFSILGDSFDLMDGVLGMALEPYQPGQDRRLIYHAMSSPTENWVYTSDLRNRSRFMHDPSSSPQVFHTFTGERRTQSAAAAIDRNGIMFFGLMSDVTIDCWNTRTEYSMKSIDVIAQNSETLQFASGVKVITNRNGVQELWIMTSRFQKVATDTLSTSETNFRIQAAKVDDLIFSTKCKNRHASSGNYQQAGHSNGGGGYGLRPNPNKYHHHYNSHTHY